MDLLSEGQKIALIFEKDSKYVEMLCIIDKLFDDRINIQLPQYFMRYVDCLQEGDSLTAKVFSKIGTVDFNSVVITSPLDEDENAPFSIELDYNAMKLTPSEDIPVINAMEKLEIYQNNEVIKLKTFEISTEYMKFYSDKKFEVETEIECAVILPKDYGIINFKAIVTEIDPIYENEYTAKYSMMTEEAKQNLLYYMYLYSEKND